MQDSKGDTDVKSILLDSVGEGKGRNDLREQHGKMFITMCKIDDHASSRPEAGHPNLGLWDTPEGWGGR